MEPTVDIAEPTTRPSVDPAGYPAAAGEWGENVTGVKTRMATDRRAVALTFDACGGSSGSGYDEALIEFLLTEEVPATLFFNQRWIDANERTFDRLAQEELFGIANHGTAHRPLSVEGKSAYGITGTDSPASAIDEVMTCQEAIRRRTGRSPAFFRSGTAYYDEVAVRIANDLGLEVVNYDVLGDAGATFTSTQVAEALGTARAGSIALLHMNHPGSGTARGVMAAVPELRARGFEFVRLGEYPLA
ncbi:polysaccharide deacetylase family protein [Phytoactinopolyspora halotolerans]|uniref:Polysaccharide deacetylase family protein n=2 Tax=Phytoactinopolyspora halotolerans TaxID=1981512 RepID=A0A6L9SB64_9ACTN|nr:polysaccharide deacetylase family protein [Phytoactinopolyspora halotolerans]